MILAVLAALQRPLQGVRESQGLYNSHRPECISEHCVDADRTHSVDRTA